MSRVLNFWSFGGRNDFIYLRLISQLPSIMLDRIFAPLMNAKQCYIVHNTAVATKKLTSMSAMLAI
jgi:hypothetical protein